MSVLVWSRIGALAVATPYLLLIADLPSVPLAYWPVLGALSVLILVAISSFYKAIQTSLLALISPIISAHLVVVILLAVVFMGERLGAVQVLGISIAFVGVVLASMTTGDSRAGSADIRKGVVLGMAAMLAAGLFVFGIGNLSKELGWFLPIYLVRLGAFGILLPSHLVTRHNSWHGNSTRYVLIAALVGILQFTGLAAYAMGSQIGPVSIVAASFSVYPVIPVVGGFVLFNEKLASRQAVGIASALGGG